MIQIFSLTLAANESRDVAISGEYFELRNAVEPIALVELLDRSGSVISRLENPEQSDYVKPGRYETIRITNGPTAQTVRHFYGSGDAGSRRTSGQVQVEGTVDVMGDVSVIDGEKNRAIAGGMFAGITLTGAVAGQYSNLQMWNPAGSGKNLIISTIETQTGAVAASFHVLTKPAPLGNLYLGINPPYGNKKSGGGAPIAELRYENMAAAETYPQGIMKNVGTSAGQLSEWNVKGGIILPPGSGLNLHNPSPNTPLSANFEWFEEPV